MFGGHFVGDTIFQSASQIYLITFFNPSKHCIFMGFDTYTQYVCGGVKYSAGQGHFSEIWITDKGNKENMDMQ